MQASKYGYLLLLGVACAMPACFKTDAGDDDDDDNGGASGESSGGSSSGSGGKGGSTSGGSGGTTSSGGSGGSISSGGSGGSSAGTSGTGGGVCSASDVELVSDCADGTVSQYDDPDCAAFYSCYFAYVCSNSGTSCGACLDEVQAAVATSACTDPSTFEYIGEACIQSSQSFAGCEL